jgi:DNA-binding transcriptional LysR family regulator
MNLNQLNIFVTVVEQKGFSAASRLLGISPTAVSKQVQSLENHLSVQLIIRTSTTFEVTDVGMLFYGNCKKLIKDFSNLEDLTQSFQQEPSGSLRVFSSSAFAETFIVPHMSEFTAIHPKIHLTLDIADRIPDVQREDIDLCFGLIGHWDQDLIQKKFISTRTGIYASPVYLEKYGEPKSRKDLENHRFICHANRPDSQTITFSKGPSIHIEPSIAVNDHTALLTFAKDGLGPIVLFEFMAQALVEAGQLQPILTNEEMPVENYYVYYPPTHHMKPAAKAFLDFVFSKR